MRTLRRLLNWLFVPRLCPHRFRPEEIEAHELAKLARELGTDNRKILDTEEARCVYCGKTLCELEMEATT